MSLEIVQGEVESHAWCLSRETEKGHCSRNTGKQQKGNGFGQGDKLGGIAVIQGEVIGTEGTSRRDRICSPGSEAKKSESP